MSEFLNTELSKEYSKIHIRNIRGVDPQISLDAEVDLIIGAGKVERIGVGLVTPKVAIPIDGRDLVIFPGLIDVHAHLREPGEEYKEDLNTASASASAGGFTAVCAMPNTFPPNDCRAVTELILSRARGIGGIRVYPVGAISRGLEGKELSDIGEMKEAGVIAISDDGRPVVSARLMRRALEYARSFELPVIQHAEDLDLSEGGVMHEGACSTRAGLRGQPSAAEEVMVARDLALVELTGAQYHVAHISTANSVKLIRDAKKRGLPVSCEVTPHHLTLTDEACLNYDTSTKVNPPLRTSRDVDVLLEALSDGTIDMVATDHAPHSTIEKLTEFDCAAFGILGFETAFPLIYRLVEKKILTLNDLILRMSIAPSRKFRLPAGSLSEGSLADFTIVELGKKWIFNPDALRSKSRNTPFKDWEFCARVAMTIVGGKIIYHRDQGDRANS